MGLRNQTFDDRDTTSLIYSSNSGWFNQGEWNASDVGPDDTGTLSSSIAFNANVTFTFPVPANAFYYYGMKRSGGGRYLICIDCNPDAPNFTPIDALDPNDNGRQPPVLLFSKSFSSFGVHEVILTNTNDTRRNPAGTSQITIDRFEIQVQDDSVPSSSSTSSTTSSTSSSSSAATSSASSSSQPIPVGVIAGGVIGGLALIAVTAIVLLCIRRQRNNARRFKRDSEASGFPSSSLSPHNPSTLPSSSFGSPQSTQDTYVFPGTMRKHQYNPSSTSGALTLPSDVTSPTASSGSGPTASRSRRARSGVSSSSGSRRPRREVDAGRIVESESEYDGSETLPPDYDQVFRPGRSSRGTAGPSRVENPDDSLSSNGARSATSQERRALPTIPQREKT